MYNDKDVRDYAEEHNCSYVNAYRVLERKAVGLPVKEMGGEGSGNFGHSGREGEVGGSGEGGGGGGKVGEVGGKEGEKKGHK